MFDLIEKLKLPGFKKITLIDHGELVEPSFDRLRMKRIGVSLEYT